MTHPVVLNELNPSPEVIHQWAFDLNLWLIEQDEDLVLSEIKHVPLLLALSRDESCPKQATCFAIVDRVSRGVLLGRDIDGCRLIHRSIDAETKASPITSTWAKAFGNAYDRLLHPRKFERREAQALAKWLLPCDFFCREQIRSNRTHG